MLNENIKAELNKILREDEVIYDEPMKYHTTMKIGGPVDVFIATDDTKLSEVIKILKTNNVDYFIVGNGSDLLVSDKGIRGAVIYTKGLNCIEVDVENETVKADSGVSLNQVANAVKAASLTGMEFASGIPGSIGGAIFMNAGAYGGEMKGIVESVTYLDENAKVCEILKDDLDFYYRHSFFTDNPKCIILSAKIKLKKGNYDEIDALQTDLEERRRLKQPLKYASAGSKFKRPKGHFAGQLIQNANLSGYSVGDAQVSTKHSGFCINKGNATCNDMLKLINHIISEVKKTSGVTLEPEVKIIGEI